MTLAQDNLEAYAVCYQKAVDRLSKVRFLADLWRTILTELLRQIIIENEYSADYVYYKIPIPWLQVKLLRLLQYYPPSGKLLEVP